MAPIRRYLRITKYSILEVRVYLDNPALADSWLLNPRDPVLPRVIQAIRPLVLPKLREENSRIRSKSKKQKGVKDSIVEDDFEVSIFLTDTSTRHSVLTRQKRFSNKDSRARRKTSDLTGWLTGNEDQPIDVEDDENSGEAPIVVREESDDDQDPSIKDFPPFEDRLKSSSSGRKRQLTDYVSNAVISDDEGFEDLDNPRPKKLKATNTSLSPSDDKKKLDLHTEYDGFSIYGRILCLVVKQRGRPIPASASSFRGERHMLESWVSTQAAREIPVVDD